MSRHRCNIASRYILKLGKAVGGTFGKPLGTARAFDFSLQVSKKLAQDSECSRSTTAPCSER